MRVGIDYTAAVNQTAGIGRFVRCLVAALLQQESDHSYVLVHARPNSDTQRILPEKEHVRLCQLPLSERWLNILWHRLKLPVPVDLLTGPLDLFHSPDFVLPPLRPGRIRTVLTIHDLAFLIASEHAHAHLREYLMEVVPRSARRADFVIADSESTRNDVICLLGVPPARVAVIPGGVEARFVRVDDEARLQAARRQLGLGDWPFILFVGVVEPRKNLRRLIEAFAFVKRRTSIPHHLVLVGKRGWLSDDIYASAERSPYREEILFTGFAPDDDLPALYSAADLFTFPSVYEGFGLPVLEAMACGTPVVTSTAASLPEVAGDAGLKVDPDDTEQLAEALEQALCDQRLRADLRRRGLEQAKRFTWEASARKLLEVYGQVAQM